MFYLGKAFLGEKSNNWIQKPDLPSYTRHHPFYFGINDEVYVGFGHGSNPDNYGNYIYKDFWKSFLGIKHLLLAKMKLIFLVS